MNIVCDRKKGNYTIVPNAYLRDKALSLKAKGLLTLIISLPENWKFSAQGLAALCLECKGTVAELLTELEQSGYLRRTRTRRAGRFGAWRFEVFERPQRRSPAELPAAELPAAELPATELPATESSPQLRTYQEKKENKPPHTPPRGDGCVRREKTSFCPERFDAFWERYPRHEDRQGALRAWNALRPDEGLYRTLMEALERQRDSDAWRRGIGIPYAGRWLEKHRWEDEPMESPREREREWDMGYIPQDIQLVW